MNEINITENKDNFIEGIQTDTKYFFANKKIKTYAIIFIERKKKNYLLKQTLDVAFNANPIEFEEALTTYTSLNDKGLLYNELQIGIDLLIESGHVDLYYETDEYFDEPMEYISDVTAGVPYVDYYLDSSKAIYQFEKSNNESLRYDVYDTAIKVNKDSIKNNTYFTQELYTLWYPNFDAVNKAIKPLIESKKLNAYSFEEFKRYAEKIENLERLQLQPRDIIFEHIVNVDEYLSSEISGLQISIPNSEFAAFDPSNLEEGRVYFWIKHYEKDILKSKIRYFVLQNRKNEGYIIGSSKLQNFNQKYYQENYLSTDSMADEIVHLKRRVEKGYVEISQEEIIGHLTNKKASDVISQKTKRAIFLDYDVFDIYQNIVQHWAFGSSKEDFVNHTLFFESEEKRDEWIKKELSIKRNDGYESTNKEKSSNLIQHYSAIDELNTKYLEQRTIKDKLLENHPSLKTQLTESEFKVFMKYSPLEIIEGDYEIKDSLLLDADNSSLIITGDLIVGGTFMTKTKESWYSDNYLIVLGEVRTVNYVHNAGYRLMLFAKDFLVEITTYLPAASRSWFINIQGKLTTDTFIHTKDEKMKGKDKNIIFKKEFSTTNKNIFIDGFFNEKKRSDIDLIFYKLSNNENLLLNNLDSKKIDDDLLLTAFKRHLRNWHDLYYEFAGFELQDLEIGEHYGHYIESDVIVKDVRHDTGMYLMSHDDYSLELVKTNKPIKKNNLASKNLAYRFFWIMWTFSNWNHRTDGPMDYWESIEQIDTRYKNGQAYFNEDTYLALYWVMHFGLLEDPRFNDMKVLMGNSKCSLLQGAFLFFEELKKEKGTYCIEIDNQQNTTLFSQRIKHHKEQLEKAKL